MATLKWTTLNLFEDIQITAFNYLMIYKLIVPQNYIKTKSANQLIFYIYSQNIIVYNHIFITFFIKITIILVFSLAHNIKLCLKSLMHIPILS